MATPIRVGVHMDAAATQFDLAVLGGGEQLSAWHAVQDRNRVG
jgi:hypothetical protein